MPDDNGRFTKCKKRHFDLSKYHFQRTSTQLGLNKRKRKSRQATIGKLRERIGINLLEVKSEEGQQKIEGKNRMHSLFW